MKAIELIPALELGNKLNVDVMDFPGGETAEEIGDGPIPEQKRKRCGITLEYAPRDVRQLQAEGMDRERMLAFYKQRVYDLVKVNIAQDWACVGGMDDVLAITAKHVDLVLEK